MRGSAPSLPPLCSGESGPLMSPPSPPPQARSARQVSRDPAAPAPPPCPRFAAAACPLPPGPPDYRFCTWEGPNLACRISVPQVFQERLGVSGSGGSPSGTLTARPSYNFLSGRERRWVLLLGTYLSPSYLASRVTTNGTGCIWSPCGLPKSPAELDPSALHSCSANLRGKWACLGQMAQNPDLSQQLHSSGYGERRENPSLALRAAWKTEV